MPANLHTNLLFGSVIKESIPTALTQFLHNFLRIKWPYTMVVAALEKTSVLDETKADLEQFIVLRQIQLLAGIAGLAFGGLFQSRTDVVQALIVALGIVLGLTMNGGHGLTIDGGSVARENPDTRSGFLVFTDEAKVVS